MFRELSSIEQERKALGLSQKELARMAGVSQSLISKIERGRLVPSYDTAVRIFQALERAKVRGGCTKASEVMTTPVISVRPDDPLSRAISLMTEKGISQLPVISGGKALGSVTEEGILKKMPEISMDTPVREVMESLFPIVPPEATLQVVRDLLTSYPAVLVQEHGKIIGIITKSDLLKQIGSSRC